MPPFMAHPHVTERIHLQTIDDFVQTIHEKHALNSPIILVQRFFRAKLKERRRQQLLYGNLPFQPLVKETQKEAKREKRV